LDLIEKMLPDWGNFNRYVDRKPIFNQLLHGRCNKPLSTRFSLLLNTSNNCVIKDSTTAEDISKLKKTEALPSRLYGLPKIHKLDVPLRLWDEIANNILSTKNRNDGQLHQRQIALTLSPGDVLVSCFFIHYGTHQNGSGADWTRFSTGHRQIVHWHCLTTTTSSGGVNSTNRMMV